MEVLIGFAVGYWVGTRQGREGLERAMDSVRVIAAHPETRRLLGVGLSAGGRGTGVAAIRGVINGVVDRRGEHQAHAA